MLRRGSNSKRSRDCVAHLTAIVLSPKIVDSKNGAIGPIRDSAMTYPHSLINDFATSMALTPAGISVTTNKETFVSPQRIEISLLNISRSVRLFRLRNLAQR